MEEAIRKALQEERDNLYALTYIEHLRAVSILREKIKNLKDEFITNTINFSKDVETKTIEQAIREILKEKSNNSKIDKIMKFRKSKILDDFLGSQDSLESRDLQ